MFNTQKIDDARFDEKRKGFDQMEVDNFLDEIVSDMKRLNKAIESGDITADVLNMFAVKIHSSLKTFTIKRGRGYKQEDVISLADDVIDDIKQLLNTL